MSPKPTASGPDDMLQTPKTVPSSYAYAHTNQLLFLTNLFFSLMKGETCGRDHPHLVITYSQDLERVCSEHACIRYSFLNILLRLHLIAQLVNETACNAGDPGLIPGSGRSAGEGIGYSLQDSWASLMAQLVKNLPAVRETWVRSLGWEDPLEKEKATHSSILT